MEASQILIQVSSLPFVWAHYGERGPRCLNTFVPITSATADTATGTNPIIRYADDFSPDNIIIL